MRLNYSFYLSRTVYLLLICFTAVITSEGGFYFCFTNENELKRWEEVADIIWEEYVEVLREYYKLIDIKHYTLPEKPKWMFMICSHSFLRK